jgi:hypothetical protein
VSSTHHVAQEAAADTRHHTRSRVEAAIAWPFLAAASIFLAFAALIAATLPFRGWDSYAFGQWSRLIAEDGGFHHAGIGAADLHRPLFYVLQGELWRVVGFHVALGRLLSLFFTALFIVAVGILAARRPNRLLTGAIGAVVATLVVDVAVHASDGLTDVPTAAMLATLAAVLWKMPRGRVRVGAITAVAALCVLAKPTGLIGVFGLFLAQAIGPRVALRSRILHDLAPLGGGVLIGLAYDASQARYLHMSLRSFLQEGVGSGIWAQRAAASRPDVVYGWDWLGRPLHVLLVYAVAYALLRIAGVRHRRAALAAALPAWIWALLGPSLAGSGVHLGFGVTDLAVYTLAAALPAAALAGDAVAPSRLHTIRLLVWALPPLVVWAEYAGYDTRLSSAAWPALVVLAAAVVSAMLIGLLSHVPLAAAVPAAALLVLAVTNVQNLDGLGADGWRQYRSHGVAGLGDARLMENVALGQFQQELDAVRRVVGPAGRVTGNDGRLGFFFPGRAAYGYPTSCDALRGNRVFVLLESDETVAQARAVGAPTTVDAWERCRRPQLTLVDQVPGLHAVFAVGSRPAAAATGTCGAPVPPDGLVAIFGSTRTASAAAALQRKVAGYGFVQAKVVQLSCSRYLVLETGVPDEKAGASIAAEARTVNLDVRIERLEGAQP